MDSIMPTASPNGEALPTQDRLDAAVAAMLRAGVFLVLRSLLMRSRTPTDEGAETNDNVCRPHQDTFQDDVHSTREADAGASLVPAPTDVLKCVSSDRASPNRAGVWTAGVAWTP